MICQSEILIGNNVSITPYCAIVDTYHPYDPPDKNIKIGDRLPLEKTFVHIGEGTFIGTKAVILPNVSIGRCCVIGAGSVVKDSFPDYCVIAGSPAKLIKKFNPVLKAWERMV